ncbi:hypothetical protein ACR6C2_25915 [Streptomyces sp. INA 01156]
MTQMSLVAAAGAFDDSGVDMGQVDRLDVGVMTASTAGGYAFGRRNCRTCGPRGPVRQHPSVLRLVLRGEHRPDLHPSRLPGPQRRDRLGRRRRPRRDRLRRPPPGAGNRVMLTGAVDSTMCPWGRSRTPPPAGCRSPPTRGPRTFRSTNEPTGGSTARAAPTSYCNRTATAATRRCSATVRRWTTRRPPRGGPRPGDPPRPRRGAASPRRHRCGLRRRGRHREGDTAEAAALAGIFGPDSVPVTAPKAATGRMGCGTASLDVAMAVLAIRDQTIPRPSTSGGRVPGGQSVHHHHAPPHHQRPGPGQGRRWVQLRPDRRAMTKGARNVRTRHHERSQAGSRRGLRCRRRCQP